jgi:ESS family glutamate:Na+ symporter
LGGPATGLAFTEQFEQLGVPGAGALIIASATFGIFVSTLLGNPVATVLIRRFHLAKLRQDNKTDAAIHDENQIVKAMSGNEEAELDAEQLNSTRIEESALDGGTMLRHLLIMLIIMGMGALLGLLLTWLGIVIPNRLGTLVQQLGNSLSSAGVTSFGVKLSQFKFPLPGYIGAMIVAALVRNTDDRYSWLRLNMRAINILGVIALALFLVIALMDLKLWQLAGLAVPMLVILCVQVVLMIIYAVFVTFLLMGRDYEAAVTASGHIGFGLGITPNAVANMEALTGRYGAAPRSFLIVPIVGAFFIDFSNALIITVFANFLR